MSDLHYCKHKLAQLTKYKLYNNEINVVHLLDFLIHDQTTNFRLFQTETVCRRQFQI